MNILTSIDHLLTITLFRFRPLARIWAILLIAVNAASLLFLHTIYGKVALAAVSVGVLMMIFIHQRLGFVRLLGIGHIFWLPMLPWIYTQLPTITSPSPLHTWLVALLTCNTISLVIDTTDVLRYVLGERQPHYHI